MNEPNPTELANALRTTADHLARCITCGQPHQQTPLRNQPHLAQVRGQTWADPVDGHTYRPGAPLGIIDDLRQQADILDKAKP